jgi:hypothetical protein
VRAQWVVVVVVVVVVMVVLVVRGCKGDSEDEVVMKSREEDAGASSRSALVDSG